jgi:hypothetical protein
MGYLSSHSLRKCLTAALVAALALLAQAQIVRAETVNVPVPQSAVIGALNTAFASMDVRLDAYGKKHTSGRYLSWLEEQSRVKVAGVGSKGFDLGEMDKKTTKTRRLRAYVNDVDVKAIAASMDGGNVRLSALFESGGYEVKIKCLRYRLLKKDWKDECVIPSLAGKGLDIDNALLEAEFRPIAHKGSMSLDVRSTDVSADVQAHGLCGALDGLCDRITNYKSKLRNTLEDTVFNLLDRDDLRDLVASRVRQALEAAGILKPDWKITAVTTSGSNFNVTIQRPDQIGADSVKILGFAAKTASVSHSCPVNAGFDATIWSKYDLKGRAWLENENGTKSPAQSWTMGNGQTATSTIARTFNGSAGTTYPGRWSRLVVEWKDQQGKAYTAKSGKAYFSVTCSIAGGDFLPG